MRVVFQLPRAYQAIETSATMTLVTGNDHHSPWSPRARVLGQHVGQRELHHPLRDHRDHHRHQHVAGRAECRHDAQLHADPAPGQRHDADESRAFPDHRVVTRNEEFDQPRCARNQAATPMTLRSTKLAQVPSLDGARGPVDIAGAHVLPDQRRHRHRQAHHRDRDDLQDVGADAIGRDRDGAERGDEERHDHQTERAGRELDRSRHAQEERALQVLRVGHESAPRHLDAMLAAQQDRQARRSRRVPASPASRAPRP